MVIKMEKVIKISVHDLMLDQKRSLLYCIGSKVNIFDVANKLKKIKVLDNLKHPNQMLFDDDLGIIIVKNTIGGFAIYNYDNFELIKRFNLKSINGNTDDDFIFDKANKVIYCIASVFKNKNLELELVKIAYETMQIDYIPLKFVLEKNILSHYSLHKIVGNELYLFYTNINNSSIIKSSYGKYLIENNCLIEIENLWETKRDFSLMKTINENLSYGFNYIVDVSKKEVYSLEKISKSVIYNIFCYNGRLAIITSDKIYFVENFETIVDTIDGKYLSCYLETDDYKFIGSWEYLQIM